jgi:hypothetical protein
MDELESQIAKIQLGNLKVSANYVFVMAEKAAGSDAEIFVVAELPVLNPAAAEACEKICQSIGSALRRSYRKPLTSASFETAIAEINEELGKLASLGQIYWINKLNCIIGVKDGGDFSIATSGKVAAFLFRGSEFTDISCSPSQSHPLKTFENFAVGKIRLDDILILSTTQLFNYLAMDRLRGILSTADFLAATQTVVELLKENAGPDVAFGTILNQQVRPGQASEEEIDLENYVLEGEGQSGKSFPARAWEFIANALAIGAPKRAPKTGLPKISFGQKLRNLKGNGQAALAKGRSFWNSLGRGVALSRNTLRLENIKNISPQRKFFALSALVLLLALIANLSIANHLKKTKARDQAVAGRLKEVQSLLANAQTSLLYNDENGAENFVAQAQNELPPPSQISGANKSLYQTAQSQLADLEKKTQKESNVQVASLGSLAQGNSLIKLPDSLAVQKNGNIINYNKAGGQVQDGLLKAGDDILAAAFLGKGQTLIYNGNALRLWDPAAGAMSQPFGQNVPGKGDFAGLAAYPTNSRVYLVNKKTGQIINFLVAGGAISRPVVAINNSALQNARDLAIDGSIYVLTDSGISKYQSGKPSQFKWPYLVKPFSGQGKIFTDKDTANIYILDAGNNRILILDKKGGLVSTLQSDKFTKLVDFQVDEKNKTIYVLNDGSLLKVALP